APDEGAASLAWFRDRFWTGFWSLVGVAVVGELAVLVTKTATSLGSSVPSAFANPNGVYRVFSETRFGTHFQVRLGLLLVLVAVALWEFLAEPIAEAERGERPPARRGRRGGHGDAARDRRAVGPQPAVGHRLRALDRHQGDAAVPAGGAGLPEPPRPRGDRRPRSRQPRHAAPRLAQRPPRAGVVARHRARRVAAGLSGPGADLSRVLDEILGFVGRQRRGAGRPQE